MNEPTIKVFGRPELPPNQKRSEVVSTRLRPSEYDTAVQRSRAAGFKSVAEYSRSLLLNGTSTSARSAR